MRPLELERVQQLLDRPGLELGAVRGAERLVRVPEAEHVDRDGPERGRQRGDRRQERGLGAAQPVEHQHRRALARLDDRERSRSRPHPPEPQPPGPRHPRRGGQEADAEVQVAPHLQPAAPERVHAPRDVGCDRLPGGGIRAQQRVRLAAAGLAEPHAAALHDHVPLLAAGHGDPDHRPRPRQVEGGVVEAVDERHQGGGRERGADAVGEDTPAVIAREGASVARRRPVYEMMAWARPEAPPPRKEMPMRRIPLLLLICAVAVLGFAGCGGDDNKLLRHVGHHDGRPTRPRPGTTGASGGGGGDDQDLRRSQRGARLRAEVGHREGRKEQDRVHERVVRSRTT